MKLRQLIILGIFLIILALIYVPILSNKEEEKKTVSEKTLRYLPIKVVKNENRKNTVTAYGQVMPNNQLEVSLEVQGIIDADNRTLKVGTSFKKGELLVKIDPTDAIYNLLSRRSSFSNLILGVLPDLSIDIPEEREKWETFLDQIDPNKSLPNLPEFKSKKERFTINSRNIPSEYYTIKAQERLLEKYYFLAPFDGTIIASSVEPGSNVTPGMRILTISKTSDYEVKAPVPLSRVPLFQQAEDILFMLPTGEKIGTGKYLRMSRMINSQTQSVDLFFSIASLPEKELIQGMFLNLEVTSSLFEETAVIPDNAIAENRVQLLQDSIVTWHPVQIAASKPDTLFVKGIPNGSKLILEPISNPVDTIKYIGILK